MQLPRPANVVTPLQPLMESSDGGDGGGGDGEGGKDGGDGGADGGDGGDGDGTGPTTLRMMLPPESHEPVPKPSAAQHEYGWSADSAEEPQVHSWQ